MMTRTRVLAACLKAIEDVDVETVETMIISGTVDVNAMLPVSERINSPALVYAAMKDNRIEI